MGLLNGVRSRIRDIEEQREYERIMWDAGELFFDMLGASKDLLGNGSEEKYALNRLLEQYVNRIISVEDARLRLVRDEWTSPDRFYYNEEPRFGDMLRFLEGLSKHVTYGNMPENKCREAIDKKEYQFSSLDLFDEDDDF